MLKLYDKTALVTGGGTGIGLGIAKALAHEGCRVAITGRRVDKLHEGIASVQSEHPILAFPCNVADRASVDDLFVWAEKALGRVDMLINSAGVNVPKRLMMELAPENWDLLMSVNATGAYNCTRKVLPQMIERRDGLIVNISSISGKRAGLLGGVAYSASKFAMSALGTAVALEVGKHNIRVTNIYPGEVETPILDQRPVPVSAEHRARILQPEDVGAAVVMIACLPPRAHIPELVIKPTTQDYA
jgi:NAD(P)-dependent dehydrogenase (short-subunit alcohol dehydrogenase family)